MVGIPKNRKLLVEIKVTLEFDGSRSDRLMNVGLTDVDRSVEPPKTPAADSCRRRSDRRVPAGRTAVMPPV